MKQNNFHSKVFYNVPPPYRVLFLFTENCGSLGCDMDIKYPVCSVQYVLILVSLNCTGDIRYVVVIINSPWKFTSTTGLEIMGLLLIKWVFALACFKGHTIYCLHVSSYDRRVGDNTWVPYTIHQNLTIFIQFSNVKPESNAQTRCILHDKWSAIGKVQCRQKTKSMEVARNLNQIHTLIITGKTTRLWVIIFHWKPALRSRHYCYAQNQPSQ